MVSHALAWLNATINSTLSCEKCGNLIAVQQLVPGTKLGPLPYLSCRNNFMYRSFGRSPPLCEIVQGHDQDKACSCDIAHRLGVLMGPYHLRKQVSEKTLLMELSLIIEYLEARYIDGLGMY